MFFIWDLWFLLWLFGVFCALWFFVLWLVFVSLLFVCVLVIFGWVVCIGRSFGGVG